MQVHGAVVAHAAVHVRPQPATVGRTDGAVPGDESTAGKTIAPTDETVEGEASRRSTAPTLRRDNATGGGTAGVAEDGRGNAAPQASRPTPTPRAEDISALQQSLGLVAPSSPAPTTAQAAPSDTAAVAPAAAPQTQDTFVDEVPADGQGVIEINLGGGTIPGGTAALINRITRPPEPTT